MRDESCPVDWAITYPDRCDEIDVWNMLFRKRICKWNWDAFIWNLPELNRLLTQRPIEFNYLYVTRFLVARAAYLAVQGPFRSSQCIVLGGIGRHKVQVAALYRHVLLIELERAVFQCTQRPARALEEDRLFQVNIGVAEKTFLEILEVIGLIDDPDFICHGYRLECWRSGLLEGDGCPARSIMPPAVSVPVQVELMRGYRKLKPAAREVAMKIASGLPVLTVRERDGLESATDLELERLSGLPKVNGYPCIRYGDECIQYYRVTTNDLKDTLYVVCADRTLRIKGAPADLPGSRPRGIFAEGPAHEPNSAEYMVRFDNGMVGSYHLSFRAHRENEKYDVPRVVWLRAEEPAGSGSRPGTAGGAGHRLTDGDREAQREGHGQRVMETTDPYPEGAAEEEVVTAGVSGNGKVRVKVTVDAEGLGPCGAQPEIGRLAERLSRKIEGVGREVYGLKQENEDLKTMQASGLFKFVSKVEPDALRLFFAILEHGDQAKAARALGMRDSSFREKTKGWRRMSAPYRVMYRLIDWRKKVGGRQEVPLADGILSEIGQNGHNEDCLGQVLEGLRAMNGANWQSIRTELEEVLRGA